MQVPFSLKLKSFAQSTSRWFAQTPERSLDQAYKAALKIQGIEEAHFQGQRVSAQNSDYGESVIIYFQTEVKNYLQKINFGLNTFKTSRFFLNLSDISDADDSGNSGSKRPGSEIKATDASIILEKLKFIDQVLDRYKTELYEPSHTEDLRFLAHEKAIIPTEGDPLAVPSKLQAQPNRQGNRDRELTGISKKSGVLPRSFMNTLNRIKQEINPKAVESEEDVIRRYRTSRQNTAISIKFILLLIIVPLLTHQVSKTFLFRPIMGQYFKNHEQIVFINSDLEEEAFTELKTYKEALEFRGMIGLAPKLAPEELEERMQARARELSEDYRQRGVDAVANVFADIFSLAGFAIVVATNREAIRTVKNFLDEVLYSLSDSAKAFLIILFTDMFVGFHSPHGWEVILEGVTRHFGLPENRDFNFLFIATFPVILDTVMKYWIFRYLNGISPSSVATYKNMNE